MSRDWTPRDTYFADKMMFEEIGKHFCEMQMSVIFKGQSTVVHPTQEEMEWFGKYPYLTITNPDSMKKIVANVKEPILLELETYVKDLCTKDDGSQRKFYSNELGNETINKWYNGELDSGFYYRERNDEYLLEYLEKIENSSEIREPQENSMERE